MDLAKIRKKSLTTPNKHGDEPLAAPSSSLGLINETLEAVQVPPVSAEADIFQQDLYSTTFAANVAALPSLAAILPGHSVAIRTPLEVILEGRTAAGCDDVSILADKVSGEIVAETTLEFLCFRASDETYGINIMDIKEIIKTRELTEVPHAPLFVSGILSLRGTIIPIIDICARLGLARKESTGKERIVVIKNNNSFSGLLVDEVIQVVQVQPDAVEAAPTVLNVIHRDFISGLGRFNGKLIIILNLEKITDINLY
jgi:purine-binding chemotaxis protein CheW